MTEHHEAIFDEKPFAHDQLGYIPSLVSNDGSSDDCKHVSMEHASYCLAGLLFDDSS